MPMPPFLPLSHWRPLIPRTSGHLLAIALLPVGGLVIPPTMIQPVAVVNDSLSHSVDQISSKQGIQLVSEGVSVSGDNGEFVGEVLVNGTVDGAWEVLTDYNNFASFLPNVEESQLVSSNGNQVVFEQVNVFHITAFTHRERVVVAATEQYPSQISFTVTEGDMESLRGTWRLQAVSTNQVLITHQVSIDPGSSIFRDVYLSVYQGELEKTLAALKQEIERRG